MQLLTHRSWLSLHAVAVPQRIAAARPVVRTHAAEEDAVAAEPEQRQGRGPRAGRQTEEKFKHYMPLPLPSHLVYVRPTVAVVTDVASRSSVGIKMTAGGNGLERYVVEYFARSVK